ncbi:hypothetical protein OB920_13295 [Halobacteria archaeon HArc-gm2]|nr:hypothetical protein [Halobacteria archaeon HArc-gm2]
MATSKQATEQARRTAQTMADTLEDELGLDDPTVTVNRRNNEGVSEYYAKVFAGTFIDEDKSLAKERRNECRDILGDDITTRIKTSCPNGWTTTYIVLITVK